MRVSNLSSIWMVHYTEPSRYNWMLQYYLRAEGLALSWVGTGRLIFSLNYTDADFAEVADRFVAAAAKMKRDGWWWHDASLTNKSIRRQILKEMMTRKRRETGSSLPSWPGQLSEDRRRFRCHCQRRRTSIFVVKRAKRRGCPAQGRA